MSLLSVPRLSEWQCTCDGGRVLGLRDEEPEGVVRRERGCIAVRMYQPGSSCARDDEG